MKKVVMFLSQGVEDLEAVTMIDVFGWTKLRSNLTSITLETVAFHDKVRGKFGVEFSPTYNLNKVRPDFNDYDAFILPGGFHDAGFDEAYSKEIHDIAKIIHDNQRLIVTMCVGILPISDSGLLEGVKATTYGLSRYHDNIGRLQKGKAIYTAANIEYDKNIISCKGPTSSLDIAYFILEKLTGEENTREVQKLMAYK
ncbi:DJ-1/PfpI family protein [Aquimarina rhabdastrellae]